MPPRTGMALQLHLPASSNSGELGRTIWLTGEETLEVGLELGIASDYRAIDVRGIVLLNGLQRSFHVDGEVRDVLRLSLMPGETAGKTVNIHAHDIEVGAHSLDILLWRSNGRAFPSPGLTVLKDSTDWFDVPDAVELPAEPMGWSGPSVRRTGTSSILIGASELVDEDGTLPLTFTISAARGQCSAAVHRVFLIAILDGRQIDIDSLGPRPLFVLREDEQIEVETVVTGLPTGDGSHLLQFWLVPANGQYWEAPLGRLAPWADMSRMIGWLYWQ